MDNLKALAISSVIAAAVSGVISGLVVRGNAQSDATRYGMQYGPMVDATKKFYTQQRANIIAKINAAGGSAAVYYASDLIAAGALDPQLGGKTYTGGQYCVEFRLYNGGANVQGALTVVGETSPLNSVDAGYAVQGAQRANTGIVDSTGNLTFIGGTPLPLSSFTGAGTCAPGANSLATLITDGDSVTTGIYLARINDGNPADSRMGIDFDVGGNNINNANNGNFTGNLYALDFIHISDKRKKHDIKRITDPWPLLASLHGYHYILNDTGLPDDGLLADEMLVATPELVKRTQNNWLAANYEGLMAPMLEEIHWQHDEIIRLNQALKHSKPAAHLNAQGGHGHKA